MKLLISLLLIGGAVGAEPLTSPLCPCAHLEERSSEAILAAYFRDFAELAKGEKWEEILSQGERALYAAKELKRAQDAAKICAQLTSTAFYRGDYELALTYAARCHEMAEVCDDPALFLRALYLESAVYRARAPKQEDAQGFFLRAVQVAEEAADLYVKKEVHDENLRGKIYFNLGAAHADNSKGNLDKAIDAYLIALDCFTREGALDDTIRTRLRLGKVYLLKKEYATTEQILEKLRPQIGNNRIAMQADYLEAQLKIAQGDFVNGERIAKEGLAKAQLLGANEDQQRFTILLQSLPVE